MSGRLYDVADLTRERPLINGRPLPPDVTMSDWLRLTGAQGFYHWLNAIHGCPKPPNPWRLGGHTQNVGWCGV